MFCLHLLRRTFGSILSALRTVEILFSRQEIERPTEATPTGYRLRAADCRLQTTGDYRLRPCRSAFVLFLFLTEFAWAADLIPVGVARIDITPETPVRMYGYAARTAESSGIAGRLTAKALAFGDNSGAGPAVLLTVDCGAVPEDLRLEVYRRISQETELADERFVLCNSHSHSAPDLKGMRAMEGEERAHLERYAEKLTNDLVTVVNTALAARQPSQLELAYGSVDFAANRRVLKEGKWAGFGAVPEAPADHRLPVLKISREDGSLAALLINYACHNTTLRGDFPQIHGDWAGCAQQEIESDQPGVVALISIGCGADSDPCPHGTVDLCQQHGRAVADEIKRMMSGSWTPINPNLSAAQTILQLSPVQDFDLEEVRQAAPRSYAIQRLVSMLDRGEPIPKFRPYRIVTWTFGDDLAMVFLSDEVVVDYTLRLQREFDAKRLWITAYAQDVSGYIVSERLIQEGGYEVDNSVSYLLTLGRPQAFQPAMEDRIVDCIKAMLPDNFQHPRNSE